MSIPAPDYPRIKRVRSFDELMGTPFAGCVNALCWQRELAGDFGEVIERLGASEGDATLDAERLLALSVSTAGKIAVDRLVEDLRLLQAHDLDPVLDCLHGYARDEGPGPVSTDVFSFHVDSATVETDTYLCTYFGPSSEGLRNDEAKRRVDVPGTRAELLRLFGGEDNDVFREYLNENCYDLHYAPVASARPFSFGVGNLWRIAVQYPGSPVPPCIHRAPATRPGQLRLLLIS
ncbi:MAG: DUF1826 domain-containing protein [Verrucomicrobia bacterium]|nr:DUF1826 domain-containing protein [Verrucomicrobiota bacterium]